MKKVGKTLLAIAIFVLPFMTYISKVDAKILNYGDVNEDGIVDGRDENAVLLTGSNNGYTKPIQRVLGDVNFDCSWNAQDTLIINQIWHNFTGTSLSSKILGENNANVKSGSYQPVYDSTCVAGYGQVEKCITGYNFSNSEAGLYSGTDDDGTTYYYRGNVENNYVSFGDMLWRIVRINGDGSIRLITQDSIGTSIWNSNYMNAKYINSDGSNSEIKTYIEAWYNTNIKNNNINDTVVSGNFCSNNDYTYSSKIKKYDVSFICNNNSLKINSEVGLINVNETIFSGASVDENLSKIDENKTTYLDNGTIFWTINPDTGAEIFSLSNSWIINPDSDYEQEVRPVINLKSDVTITGGSGTETDPYVIGEIDNSFTGKRVIMNTVNEDTENIIKASDISKGLTYSTFNTALNDGDGVWKYNWNISNVSSSTTYTEDINTEITITNKIDNSTYLTQEYNKISYLLKDKNYKLIDFTQKGDLGFTAKIELNTTPVGNSNVLYYWNAEKNQLENASAVNYTEYESVCDGYSYSDKIEFEITKGGLYILVDGALDDSLINSPQTGMMIFYIIGGIIILVGAGIGFLIYSKKTNKFPKA